MTWSKFQLSANPSSPRQISPGRCLITDTRGTIWECARLVVVQLSATFRSSPRYLFPSLCESYQDHPWWGISAWKRSRSSGAISGLSLCSLTNLPLPAVEKLKSKGRSMQSMKTLLRAQERGKEGDSALYSDLAACLLDSLDSKV